MQYNFINDLREGSMEITAENDYFKLLEDKIGELINRMQEIKDEKESFIKTIDEQKIKIESLTTELNELKESKQKARERITSILDKIEKLAV